MGRKNLPSESQNPLGLYLHIPFCKSKCAYCDFYSLACSNAAKDKQDKAKMRHYVDSLMLHMEDYSPMAEKYIVDTVFIGGGTPTIIPTPFILDIIDSMYDNFQIAEDAEFTIEANPATVDRKMLRTLRKNGVNRISFGLQSANDNELKALSRIHTFEDFKNSYEDARRAGINNINIDLMYGIPEQTKASLRHTIDSVMALEPEHISFYGLKIEDGTPFAKRQNSLRLPNEDTECDMYLETIDYLASNGYNHYEISNFSLDGLECRHNIKYWNCDEYLGLGTAAHSYFGGKRFSFVRDIEAYIASLEDPDSGASPLDDMYEVSPGDRIGEYVMLRLRLCEGIDGNEFARRFGVSFEKMYGKYLRVYTENDFMQKIGDKYSFTPKGMYVSNYILSTMLDFDGESEAKMNCGCEM